MSGAILRTWHLFQLVLYSTNVGKYSNRKRGTRKRGFEVWIGQLNRVFSIHLRTTRRIAVVLTVTQMKWTKRGIPFKQRPKDMRHVRSFWYTRDDSRTRHGISHFRGRLFTSNCLSPKKPRRDIGRANLCHSILSRKSFQWKERKPIRLGAQTESEAKP